MCQELVWVRPVSARVLSNANGGARMRARFWIALMLVAGERGERAGDGEEDGELGAIGADDGSGHDE